MPRAAASFVTPPSVRSGWVRSLSVLVPLLTAVLSLGCESGPPRPCDGGGSVDLGGGRIACIRGNPDGGLGDAAVTDAAPDAGSDAGDAGPPPVADQPDAPDCFTTAMCASATNFPSIDLTTATAATVQGVIDDRATHTFNFSRCGQRPIGDRDVYQVLAPARSMIEVIVRQQMLGAVLDPVVLTANGAGRSITFASSDNTMVSRTVFIHPDGPTNAFHVQVIEGTNYTQNFCSVSPMSFVGGSRYGYTLSARRMPFAPTELGMLTASSGPIQRTALNLTTRGDMTIFRVMVDGVGTRPEVALTLTGCPPSFANLCTPQVIPLDASGGQASYPVASRDVRADGRGTELVNWDPLSPSASEYLFAVADFDGLGGAGYTFDLEVRARP